MMVKYIEKENKYYPLNEIPKYKEMLEAAVQICEPQTFNLQRTSLDNLNKIRFIQKQDIEAILYR